MAPATARRRKAIAKVVSIDVGRATEYVPTPYRRQLQALEGLRTISSATECTQAITGLRWLKARIKEIKGNERLQRLIRKTKAAYDEAKGIETDALACYAPLVAALRDEVARFRTAEEVARHMVSSRLTTALTKRLSAGTPLHKPVRVELGDDTFDFTPGGISGPQLVTLQPSDQDAGWRKWWHVVLVDPKHQCDKNGLPIENREKGIKALAKAVLDGNAPWELLALDESEAQRHVDTYGAQLDVPGLRAVFELRPIISE